MFITSVLHLHLDKNEILPHQILKPSILLYTNYFFSKYHQHLYQWPVYSSIPRISNCKPPINAASPQLFDISCFVMFSPTCFITLHLLILFIIWYIDKVNLRIIISKIPKYLFYYTTKTNMNKYLEWGQSKLESVGIYQENVYRQIVAESDSSFISSSK